MEQLARTRYTSLSSRLQLGNISGPSGVGARMASRTTDILTSELNKMSNFFLKRAEAQAEVEGAEFGAKNAITEKQLRDGSLSGEELESQLGDTNTVFGRASRKAQLSVLETELELSARKQISEIVTNAITNDVDADTLSNDLDAVTLEYSKLAFDASPIVAQRLTANLNTISSSKYHEYAVKKANETIKMTKAKNIALINEELDAIPTILKKAISESEDEKSIDNLLGNGVQLLKKQYFNKISKFAKSSKTYEDLLDKFDDQIKASTTNYILQTASLNGQEVKLTRAIRTGNFKKVDFRIKKLVTNMTDEERKILNKDLLEQAKQRLSLEETEEKLFIQLNDDKISDLSNSILEKLGDKSRDLPGAKSLLTELKLLDRDSHDKLFESYVKELDESNQLVLDGLLEKADRGTLTLEQIKDNSSSLVPKDIDKLRDQYNKNQDKELKLALSFLTSKFNEKFEGFNPETLDTMSKKNKFLKPMSQYKRIKYILEDKLDQARKNGQPIDLRDIAKKEFDNFKDDIVDAQEALNKNNANLVLSRLKSIFGSDISGLNDIEPGEFLKINNILIRNEQKIKDKEGESKLGAYKKALEKVLD